ncbi:MAG TPA: SMC-Scp complex subunit ScpB [Polyangia bacterium]|jgi:segregation and condensation protein B
MKKRKRASEETPRDESTALSEAPPSQAPAESPVGEGAPWGDATTTSATAEAVPAALPGDDENPWGTVSGEMETHDFDAPEGEFSQPWAAPIDSDEPSTQVEVAGVTDAEPEDDAALPTDASRIESILESMLFAADRPLGLADLKRLLGEKDGTLITETLELLRQRRTDSGVQLVSVAGGWQLRTHPANGAWVAKLVAGRPQRLSRAMMETLAIVAYRQPITRPEIDEIRGVDCGPVLRTLLDRNLVRVIGKKEEVGRPMLYGTTPEFLKTFSLRDLAELPTLREFHELGAAEKAEVDAKLPSPSAATPTTDADGTPIRPATVELPQADPAEDDALFEELDRATAAAGRATAAPSETESEAEVAAEGSPAELGEA